MRIEFSLVVQMFMFLFMLMMIMMISNIDVDYDDYRGIEFSLVVQMFYPFSLQTHPHSFPGETNENVINTREVLLISDTIRNDQLQWAAQMLIQDIHDFNKQRPDLLFQESQQKTAQEMQSQKSKKHGALIGPDLLLF